MPIIVKRKGEVLASESKRHKADPAAPGASKKWYEALQRLGYVQDEWHTLARTVPTTETELKEVVARTVGSFLNGKGGILIFGVSKTGFVYGDLINRKEEDNLRLMIDEIIKKFKPMVRPDMYRVSFTPVKEIGASTPGELRVVEIRVAAGDRYELYQDEMHQVFVRHGVYAHGPLTPHEIKLHTLKQCAEKLLTENHYINLLGKKESNKLKECGDKVKEGGDKVKEGGDKVKECGDKVKEGGDKVKECGDKVKESGDKVKEGGDKVKEGGDKEGKNRREHPQTSQPQEKLDIGSEKDRTITSSISNDTGKGRSGSQRDIEKGCAQSDTKGTTKGQSDTKGTTKGQSDTKGATKGQSDTGGLIGTDKGHTLTIIKAQASGTSPAKIRSVITLNRSDCGRIQRIVRGFEGLSRATAIDVDKVDELGKVVLPVEASGKAPCLSEGAPVAVPTPISDSTNPKSGQVSSVASNKEPCQVKLVEPNATSTTSAPTMASQTSSYLPGQVSVNIVPAHVAGDPSMGKVESGQMKATNIVAASTTTAPAAVPGIIVNKGDTSLANSGTIHTLPNSSNDAGKTHQGSGPALTRADDAKKENREACSTKSANSTAAVDASQMSISVNKQPQLRPPPPPVHLAPKVGALLSNRYVDFANCRPIGTTGQYLGQGQVFTNTFNASMFPRPVPPTSATPMQVYSNAGMFPRPPPPTLATPMVYYPMLRPPSYYK